MALDLCCVWEKMAASEVEFDLEKVDMLEQTEDPVERVFDSKYAARKILEAHPDASTSSYLLYRRGLNHIATEELAEGERLLVAALSTTTTPSPSPDHQDDPQDHHADHDDENTTTIPPPQDLGPLPSLDAHNSLAVLWANRGEPQRAEHHIHQALVIYKSTPKPPPHIVPPPFQTQEVDQKERVKALETLHTTSLFVMAQIASAQGRAEESAQCCHATLERQLDEDHGHLPPAPFEWADNATKLASYYATRNAFGTASALINAAWIVLHASPSSTHPDALEQRSFAVADLNMAAASLIVDLLLAWAGGQPGEYTPQTSSFSSLFSAAAGYDDSHDIPPSPLHSLSLNPAPDFAAAKPSFLQGMKAVKACLDTYVLDGFVSKHVEASLLMGALYANLARFAPDPSVQTKLIKRKINLLHPLMTSLSYAHFYSAWLRLSFQIGSSYAQIFDTKAASGTHTPARLNQVAVKAIASLSVYLTVAHGSTPAGEHDEEDAPSEDVPFNPASVKVPDEALGDYVMARHLRGKLYTRLSADTVSATVENLDQAEQDYQAIDALLTARKDSISPEDIDPQIGAMTSEMLTLIPLLKNKASQAR